MLITIKGDCPSKKNSRVFSFRGRRPMSFPGAHYSGWHRDASKQLLGKGSFTNPIEHIFLTFYPATKRKGDLTNKAESIMDLLVDNNVIEDDNWFICGRLTLSFGGVDTKNPRVEINII